MGFAEKGGSVRVLVSKTVCLRKLPALSMGSREGKGYSLSYGKALRQIRVYGIKWSCLISNLTQHLL